MIARWTGIDTNGSSVTHMTIGKYEGNTADKMVGGFAFGELGRLLGHANYSRLGNFHVHPNGSTVPSGADENVRDDWKKEEKSTMFFILTNSTHRKGYDETPY